MLGAHRSPKSDRLRRRLVSGVSTTENPFISPMLIQTAFSFPSVVQRLVCRFSGLRLLALRHFPAFLASSPCVASASSYCFRSAAPPRWRSAFSQFVPVAKSGLAGGLLLALLLVLAVLIDPAHTAAAKWSARHDRKSAQADPTGSLPLLASAAAGFKPGVAAATKVRSDAYLTRRFPDNRTLNGSMEQSEAS